MSLLKAIKAQLGLSNTPANNFTITAEADNGTLKLARGNAGATTQDILTVDVNGKAVFTQNVQTWQDVRTSRVLGTTYTNTTPLPITISVQLIQTGASANVPLIINGMYIDNVTTVANTYGRLGTIIPAGASYMIPIVAGVSISNWMELR